MTWGANGTLFVGSNARATSTRSRCRQRRAPSARGARIASGLREPVGRRVSRRRAVRVGGRAASCASTTSRRGWTDPPRAGGRDRPLPDRRPSRLQVHRVRPRRQALRAGRRAVQHLRARPRPLREHHAHERRRQRTRGRSRAACATPSASTGIRGRSELWFTDNGRDMLGDDVPPDELNHATRAGMHFGYPYCHGGDDRGSRVRRQAPVQRIRAAGAEARPARRGARHALLHRHAVSAGVPQPDLHRRARLVEPQRARSATA